MLRKLAPRDVNLFAITANWMTEPQSQTSTLEAKFRGIVVRSTWWDCIQMDGDSKHTAVASIDCW